MSKKIVIEAGTAFVVEPGKSYVIHMPDLDIEDSNQLRDWFKERGVTDLLLVTTASFSMAEVQK